jgi:hypothetical protein
VRMQAATAEREHMARLLEKEEVIVPQLQQRLTAVRLEAPWACTCVCLRASVCVHARTPQLCPVGSPSSSIVCAQGPCSFDQPPATICPRCISRGMGRFTAQTVNTCLGLWSAVSCFLVHPLPLGRS